MNQVPIVLKARIRYITRLPNLIIHSGDEYEKMAVRCMRTNL